MALFRYVLLWQSRERLNLLPEISKWFKTLYEPLRRKYEKYAI